MKYKLITVIVTLTLTSPAIHAVEPEDPTVIFDTDFALPSMPTGDGLGTPVCIDDSSGLLVAGCDGVVGPPGADSTVPGPQGEPGTPGADSTVPGPQGEKGDPGISLPLGCVSGEALNGLDIDGLPVCVPITTVRTVEGVWSLDDEVGPVWSAVTLCPAGLVPDLTLSGVVISQDSMFELFCLLLDPSNFGAGTVSFPPPTAQGIECRVRSDSSCVQTLKCVAVCEPA